MWVVVRTLVSSKASTCTPCLQKFKSNQNQRTGLAFYDQQMVIEIYSPGSACISIYKIYWIVASGNKKISAWCQRGSQIQFMSNPWWSEATTHLLLQMHFKFFALTWCSKVVCGSSPVAWNWLCWKSSQISLQTSHFLWCSSWAENQCT